MADKYYTGVGSRETPAEVLSEMKALGQCLAEHGFTLRSGGAEGADCAFEEGARGAHPALLAIYLPWLRFNRSLSPHYRVGEDALRMASTVHPAWDRLSEPVRLLHGRNCYQVLGKTLDNPSLFLVCWTVDGCESVRTRSSDTGGTATAIVLAEKHGVPVFNLANAGRRSALAAFLRTSGVHVPENCLNEPAGTTGTLF